VDRPAAAADEQLRRLKNTVMGAGYRLSQLAKSGQVPDDSTRELALISRELTDVAQRLERLLGAIRRDG
jgi:hypothetical protein